MVEMICRKQSPDIGSPASFSMLDVSFRQVRKGCSVQVVHPQRFCPEVSCLLSKLEAHCGGSNCGTHNIYIYICNYMYKYRLYIYIHIYTHTIYTYISTVADFELGTREEQFQV